MDPKFSGTITDSIGRKVHFQNGVRIKGNEQPYDKAGTHSFALDKETGKMKSLPVGKLEKQAPEQSGQQPLKPSESWEANVPQSTYVPLDEQKRIGGVLGVDSWVLRKVSEKDVQKLDAIASRLRDPEQKRALEDVINRIDNAVMNGGGYSFIPKGTIRPGANKPKPLPITIAGSASKPPETKKPATRPHDVHFLKSVQKAYNATKSEGGILSSKRLIADVYNEWKKDYPDVGIDAFKGKLNESRMAGLPMTRLDMPQYVEGGANRSQKSTISHLNAEFHLLHGGDLESTINGASGSQQKGATEKRGVENTKPIEPSEKAPLTHSILTHRSPKNKKTDRKRSKGETAYSNILHNQVEPTHEEWGALSADLPKLGRDQLNRLVRRFKVNIDREKSRSVAQLRKGIEDHIKDITEYGTQGTGVPAELGKDRRSGKHQNEAFTQFRPVRNY